MIGQPREVMGIDGKVAVLGPDEILVVRLSRRGSKTAMDQARAISEITRGQAIVVTHDTDVAIVADNLLRPMHDLRDRVAESARKLEAMAADRAEGSEGRKRLESKAEGVRLVWSYIDEYLRDQTPMSLLEEILRAPMNLTEEVKP